MKVVLSGGGTGGHIYPAVAIARQCEEEEPGSKFLYIGGKRGLESKLIPEENIPFESIDITGFQRKISIDNVKTIVRFLKGVQVSKGILTKFKPDVVVGTGGYVCGPVVYAAAKLGIPCMIHEQNAISGLTNSFLSRYVDTVAVSFENTQSSFPKARNVIYTGNPRATTVYSANRNRGFASLGIPMDSSVVLIVGGSRGARAINETMVEMAPLLYTLKHLHFVYVTGDLYFDETRERIRSKLGSMPNHLHVLPYVHNMPEVLAATSLIVNRAGASFLAEINSLGIPSILIPSPNVTNNHQEANARTLEKVGAAQVILEQELTAERLFRLIDKIMGNLELHKAMSQCSSSLGKPESAHLIANEMRRLSRLF
ncbi:undecaprenyldiphospho-muramoylpentapeptide beta-N-acetylglucosaminyltransferase [Paenibacillus crassostreae]|uniref:UDP-N-acetylglucosamine--N-acetylmuramyl-(pentapeptide) pyrophosphoryl-undecaprenol N-acetylglucosamine transferase n=1 Tax=Paenibacillus crassostreae TaxID=1763538 RepID=A0A162KRH9_9BACL|nr:undecaprenyldiphospho-muramoylpentapeptide beta-N-acetylglucosaminyltransferase [Paenibacillus crassostreae]AOZ91674.1 undecaprenyldiphospho-muramoylpentapeptide beta-N-acetylglucosaminyltransferase [Paenibacillus crassostreae]OAB72753.1 UDP-N-acetylglucosamine--N-acetylmuramyl-(pentapeptide) pyrophosphoryl-undecaprenol N-acetylglucosamine transferase [Paenibacillus crassostreae]